MYKYLAGLLLLLGVLGTTFFGGAHWQGGKDARVAAEIAHAQAVRDGIAAATFDAAVKRAERAEAWAALLNRSIEDEYKPKLVASTAYGARLARLLHAALASGGGSTAPQVEGDGGIAPPSGESPSTGSIGGEIERLVGEGIAACRRDEVRFTALQEEVKAYLSQDAQ